MPRITLSMLSAARVTHTASFLPWTFSGASGQSWVVSYCIAHIFKSCRHRTGGDGPWRPRGGQDYWRTSRPSGRLRHARPREGAPGASGAHVGHQLAVFRSYHNFCLPHASLRRPLPQPGPTNGSGSATEWQPRTPAMAAGLTAHVWTLREVLMFRVPPWPQLAGANPATTSWLFRAFGECLAALPVMAGRGHRRLLPRSDVTGCKFL